MADMLSGFGLGHSHAPRHHHSSKTEQKLESKDGKEQQQQPHHPDVRPLQCADFFSLCSPFALH